MAQGEKPKAPAPKPTAPAPAPAPVDIKPKAPAPAPKPTAPRPKSPKGNISAINQAAIDTILKNAKREVEEGTMTGGEYDSLAIWAAKITNNDDAADFIADNQKGAE